MDSSKAVADSFAELLIAERRKAGVTQEELAHRAGLNRTTISQVEKAKAAPRLDTLIRLAGALEVDPSDLLPALRWKPPASSPSPEGRFVKP